MKSELRGHQSHVNDCFIFAVIVWKYLKAEVMEQVKREKKLKTVKKREKKVSQETSNQGSMAKRLPQRL